MHMLHSMYFGLDKCKCRRNCQRCYSKLKIERCSQTKINQQATHHAGYGLGKISGRSYSSLFACVFIRFVIGF